MPSTDKTPLFPAGPPSSSWWDNCAMTYLKFLRWRPHMDHERISFVGRQLDRSIIQKYVSVVKRSGSARNGPTGHPGWDGDSSNNWQMNLIAGYVFCWTTGRTQVNGSEILVALIIEKSTLWLVSTNSNSSLNVS